MKPDEPLSSFFSDLEQLLKQQLKAKPQAQDLRLKLLELYFDTGRRSEFLAEAHVLARATADKAQSREWQKVASWGRTLASEDPLWRDDGGKLEFVDVSRATAQAAKHKRFGDDPVSQRRFKELAEIWDKLRADPAFLAAFDRELLHFAGRPSSLFHAKRLSDSLHGAQIYLKREDLSPPGTHLMLSVLGQAMTALKLGKKTLVAATSNGHKGVITASIAAHFGLSAVIYMDGDDMHKQSSNVFRMWLLGADVRTAERKHLAGGDVRQAALDHWNRESTASFLVMGLDAAPHPYPAMAVDFSAAIGREAARQIRMLTQRAPNLLVTRAGNNADAVGLFPAFLNAPSVRMVCVENSGSLSAPARLSAKAAFDPLKAPLSDKEQRVAGAILEGLDYPSTVREHAWLKASGRVEYLSMGADLAKHAVQELSHREGLIPAIETAHALAWAMQAAKTMPKDQTIVVLFAEPVDKDIWDIGRALGVPF